MEIKRFYEVIMLIYNDRKSRVLLKDTFAVKKPQNKTKEIPKEDCDIYYYYHTHLKDAIKQASFLCSVENIEIEYIDGVA